VLDGERWVLGLDYGDITLLQVGAPDLAELEGLDIGAIGRRLRMSGFEAISTWRAPAAARHAFCSPPTRR